MPRNTLYLIIGALLVVVIALAIYMWREEQSSGVEIKINESGISVEGD